MTSFFCCLLQSLETDQEELRMAALYCLSQLAQSIHKIHQDKSIDASLVQYFDNIKSPCSSSELSQRSGSGDHECHPEYMVEELCKVLITLFMKIELETMRYQCSQDELWPRVCSCLASVLAVSCRGRLYGIHVDFPRVLLASLQGVRDHLSVLGKPVETIRNANHSPTMRVLYWMLMVIGSCMVDCIAAKECFADGGISASLNRLWPWCMITDQLRRATLILLFNFTNGCPKAWSCMCTCVGGRCLLGEVCTLCARECTLQSSTRPCSLLLLCIHTLRHCADHAQCRSNILKSDILLVLFKSIIRERGRGGSTGVCWTRLACAVSRYSDGSAALLSLRAQLPSLPPNLLGLALPALAHAAHHHRQTLLQAPDLLELLAGTLLAGDTTEMVSAARAVWALAANNHKAKLLLRSAGVAAAVQSALQRLRRANKDPSSQRALELLTYTNTVLQAT
ncbi:unnamed protein product [Diatraea saccharalis]|uniref:Uncharacterized protein n=1 Tax=Diatraea saccharalis TaxID=40085 RepID=A0A9N9QV09_9NEOP|nr:unnamed protein product [Diatraea saccharalis]